MEIIRRKKREIKNYIFSETRRQRKLTDFQLHKDYSKGDATQKLVTVRTEGRAEWGKGFWGLVYLRPLKQIAASHLSGDYCEYNWDWAPQERWGRKRFGKRPRRQRWQIADVPARHTVWKCIMVKERAVEGTRKSRAGGRRSPEPGWALRVRAVLAIGINIL